MIAIPCAGALRRLLPALLVFFGLLAATGLAMAQVKPPDPAASAPAPVAAAELERLVSTLQDEPQRTRLVEQLRGLIAAQRGLDAAQPDDAATLLGKLSERLDDITEEILAAAAVLVDAPRLIAYVEVQMSDETARARWLEVSWKILVTLGAALTAQWGVRRLVSAAAHRLREAHSGNEWGQMLVLVERAVLETLPIVAFALAAYVVLPLTQPRFATSQVALTFIGAILAARVILAVARTLLLPNGSPPFLRLNEETQTYLFIWLRRFTSWAVYGYAAAEATWWLGIPGGLYAIVLKTAALVLAVLGIVFVLQNKRPVATWLRGRRRPAPGTDDAEATVGNWRILRNRLADIWHILAIAYIIGMYAVYALRIEGGFLFVLRATALSVVVFIAARVIVGIARRLSHRGFAVSPEFKVRFPTIEARANRYLPVLMTGLAVVVYALAGLTVLQAWGADAFSWFQSSIGRRFTGGLVSIGTVVLIGLIVWELFSSTIERYLSAVDDDGRPVARSARARTLLPLLRTAMMVLIIAMVALIVLSELGVNIAPLLAGAGVVGLAIGFGSQALVKDVITGLFILIEDTLSVGDVVDVGKGHSGVVEAISIRTIKLRDASGTLHTIPFGEVSTVRNMTRDFAYYVANVAVSYREDTDRVIAILREVADDLTQDPMFQAAILAPLEVFGVDKLTETGVVIQARIKTQPMKQWSVGREFNRRMKHAFDKHGVEMPYTMRPGYLEGVTGAAPLPRATP